MQVSNRVLSELKSREAALEAQVEAAREQARREVEAAQQQALNIIRDAESKAQAMQNEHEQALEHEAERIREEARASQAHAAAYPEHKIGQAAEQILRAVLP